MTDPRTLFSSLTAAYAYPVVTPGVQIVDVLRGEDLNGIVPQGIVTSDCVAFHGTWDFEELVQNLAAWPSGDLAEGVEISWGSLVTQSGVPLSTYSDRPVIGHSRGADMAAKWSEQFTVPFQLFAYPRLCGSAITRALDSLAGIIWRMDLDPVAAIETGWPQAPQDKVTWLKSACLSFDPIYYHRWTTYQEAIAAFQAQNPLTP